MGVESTDDDLIKMLPNGHKAELKSQREKKLLVSTSITTGNLASPCKMENSEDLYRIEGWRRPNLSMNAAGHVTVSPKGERGGSLDLF
ncbi:MAG: arginine decarboxylase, partial [Dolichospermum sp.]